ncbi:restriction endonuclease subunit S [Winogradskyella sp.]|uniref:restriction endonuclease subunit S n=1 Tax=Winogradskyella sp. TaxID=1883156 RepID=UPI001B2D5E18|nr:restriction endonuclease subunit S [Winogradskyella sp.]MBO6880901.1 restriction endonuclease subunit S [Winogradskyella sp.]
MNNKATHNNPNVIARSESDEAISSTNASLQGESMLSEAEVKQSVPLVPQLRFAEFEGEWVNCKLGDVSNYTKGFAFKSKDYREEGIRIIRVSDLSADSIKKDNDKVYISESVARDYKKYELKSGNIIITTVGSKPEMIESAVGRGIYIQKNEGLLNQNMLKFENIKGVQNSFLIGLINNKRYQHYMKSIARGNANQANITVVDLLQYKISIPTLPEQQKIASFLTAVDTKTQQLTQKKNLLEQYKKGVMQQLFSQQLRFKQPDGSDYPDWEEKKLGEIAERVAVKNVANEVNFVLTNSATQGIVSQQEYFDKDIANQNNLQGYYIVSKDDFVYNPRISTSAPVGPIKRNKLKKGVMSPLYSVFRFSEPLLEYFEHNFETINWHRYLHSVANFGARHDRMNITNSDFFKMPIPMPCIEERKKITNYLSALDSKIESVAQQIEKTQEFKKGLLQQMFM